MKKRIFSLVILYVFLFTNSVSYADETIPAYDECIKQYTINFLSYIDKDPKADIMHTDVVKGKMSFSFVTPLINQSTNKTYYYGTPEMFVRTMYTNALGHEFKDVPVPSGKVNYGKNNHSLKENDPDGVLKVATDNGKRGNDFKMVSHFPKNDGDDPTQEEILKWYEETLHPGDVLECFHHVMIYLGDVTTKKSDGTEEVVPHVIGNMRWIGLQTYVGGKLPRGLYSLQYDRNDRNYTAQGMHYTTEHRYTKLISPAFAAYLGSKACPVRVWRLTDEAISKLDPNLFNTGSGLRNATYYEIEDILDLSMFEDADKMEFSKFYYNGMPDGKYSVTRSIFQMIIDNFGQIFDYLIGIATMWIRMIFVGWAAIVEKLINVTMTAVSGGQDVNSVKVNATEVDTGDAVNIEKIIFNEVSIFDVNFFNFNDENEETED